MASEQKRFAQSYTDLLLEWSSVLSNIIPPNSSWFGLWLSKYPYGQIRDAIRTLAPHAIRNNFTTDQCGKSISSSLRKQAIARALAATAGL